MSVVSKILTILLFLLSIVFVFFALKMTARINRQNDMVAKLQETIDSQGQAIASLESVLGIGRSTVADLRAKNEQLTENLASARSEIARLTGELEAARQEIARLTGELEAAKQQIAQLETEKQNLQTQLADMTSKKEDLEKKLADQTATAEGLTKQLRAVQSVIAAHPALWSYMVNPPQDRVPTTNPEDVAVPGQVIMAAPEGLTAVAFDGNVKITKGETLYAFRGTQALGKLGVGDVYRTIAVFQRSGEHVTDLLTRGDTVRPKQRVEPLPAPQP